MSFLINPYAFGGYDPDAADYISRVEIADGQALETSVKTLITNLFIGSKSDGIFGALKACCIMAAARTIPGALTPLLSSMPAPTNVGFVAGDYDRKTGLKGDGASKYLNSNRNNNADPQNSNHNAVYITDPGTLGGAYMATRGAGGVDTGANAIGAGLFFRSRSASVAIFTSSATGLVAISRSSSSSYIARFAQTNNNVSVASETPNNYNLFVFARNTNGVPQFYTDARLFYYSIGESLDLALLDARVSTFMSSLAALSL